VKVRVSFELEFDRELSALPEELESVAWASAVAAGSREALARLGVVGVVPGRREITLVDDGPETTCKLRRGGGRG
jgi:hypothetical protein